MKLLFGLVYVVIKVVGGYVVKFKFDMKLKIMIKDLLNYNVLKMKVLVVV